MSVWKSVQQEMREVVWLASVVGGLSVAGGCRAGLVVDKVNLGGLGFAAELGNHPDWPELLACDKRAAFCFPPALVALDPRCPPKPRVFS